MNVTLSPETAHRVQECVESGTFESAEAIVEVALDFFLRQQASQDDDLSPAELVEVNSAISESREQLSRGEGMDLAEFEQYMRSKYGIPR